MNASNNPKERTWPDWCKNDLFVLLISIQSGYRSENHLGHNTQLHNDPICFTCDTPESGLKTKEKFDRSAKT